MNLVGRVLQAYELTAVLGRGGMGEVYAARHVRTGREVAVKVLLERDPNAIRRFQREAESIAALRHAGIVSVLDFDVTDDGIAFLAMERLDGEGLDEHLKNAGALPFARASALLSEIADAVQAAHDVGILHRDLKPSNVFLARQAGAQTRAKLLDFGIAKLIEAGTKITATGMAIGTPAYMAPEQARAENLDGRADVYSLAAMFYEMLSGEIPFPAPTPTAMMARALTDPPPRVSERVSAIPPGLDELMLSALSKSPEDRPGSPNEFARALRALDPHAVPLPATRITEPPRVPAKREGTWMPIAIGVGFIGIAMLVVAGIAAAVLSSSPAEVQIESEILTELPPREIADLATTNAEETLPAVGSESETAEVETAEAETAEAETVGELEQPAREPRRRRTSMSSMNTAMSTMSATTTDAPEPEPEPEPVAPSEMTTADREMTEEMRTSYSISQLFTRGEYDECLRRTHRERRTMNVLMWELQCARQLRNQRQQRATCDEIGRRFPDDPRNQFCQTLREHPNL